MVRGIEGSRIFRDPHDYEDFLNRLATSATAKRLAVYAWALLPNHIHLLVRTGTQPLARSMRSLLTGYAGAFNRRHRRHGHLFQNRYKSIVVEEEAYFLELVRYLHLNPLRAGLAQDLSELDRYPYGGHSALMGAVERPWQATDEVLSRYAPRLAEARRRYSVFVAEGAEQGRRPELTGGGLVRSLGGWQAVQRLRRGREAYAADERILGSSEFVEGLLQEVSRQAGGGGSARRRQVDLPAFVEGIAGLLGLRSEQVLGTSRARELARARQVLAYVWVERLGCRASDLATLLGQTRSNVCLAARRGEEVARPWLQDIERWCGKQ